MNLQAYANHRKALGLRGTSLVAVIKAIEELAHFLDAQQIDYGMMPDAWRKLTA